MAPPDEKQPTDKPEESETDKTVILLRCDKHGTVFMMDEECPECKKEKDASAG